MAKTVADIAKIRGLSAEQMLKQLEAAGVSGKTATSELSAEESAQLREHMQKARSGKTIELGAKPKLNLSARPSTNMQFKRKRSFDRDATLAKEAQERAEAKRQQQRAEQKAEKEKQAAERKRQEQRDEQIAQEAAEIVRRQQEAEERKTEAERKRKEELAQAAKLAEKQEKAKRPSKAEPPKAKAAASKKSSKSRKSTLGGDSSRWQSKIDDDDAPSVLSGVAKKVVAATKQKIVSLSNKHSFTKPAAKQQSKTLSFRGEQMELSVIAHELSLKSTVLVRALFKLGVNANINSSIDFDTCSLLLDELGHGIERAADAPTIQQLVDYSSFEQLPRSAVVTIMGHVDHGKTTLLDHLRNSQIAAGEQGGITQHIGAYRVKTKQGELTFLDTPGHAAFFNMRARGAQITDVVVLVVAADDGVNKQTIEAIQHIQSANCPLVVAVTKIDKPNIDVERIRSQLSENDIIVEDWGGEVPMVQISALTGQGIGDLLETIALQAEILELKAARKAPAQGVVIESSVATGLGAVATLLVNNGELKKGDIVVSGCHYGRIRTMMDEHNKPLKQALPATPVQITGLSGVVEAGDIFQVVSSDKQARELAATLAEAGQADDGASVDIDPFASLQDDSAQLNLIIKADVHGSLEAINATLQGMGNEQVKVQIVSSGVGAIVESDVIQAKNTQALLIGFNVRADSRARKMLQQERMQPFYYSIIYELFEQIEKSVNKLQAPEYSEKIVGLATVREVFSSTKFGQVAGCLVTEGTIYRHKNIRVLRENVVIFEGELDSLKRFKDDVREVRSGTECGLGVRNYKDIQAGDQIEVFDLISNQE